MSVELNNETEDWPKRSWDLPTDVDDLERIMDLRQLVTLPVWRAAPATVRAEVERRIAS